MSSNSLLIQRDELRGLTKLEGGEGAQGTVHNAPGIPLYGGPAVYKEYRKHVLPDLNGNVLLAMVQLLPQLDLETKRRLIVQAAWPCRLVNNGRVVGFLMPKVPDIFNVNLTVPSGKMKRPLAQMQYLLNGEAWLAKMGLPVTDKLRVQLLMEVAKALHFFHGLRIAVGDFSAKNLLFSLSVQPSCYFIDCDGMCLDGQSALPQRETPDWDVRSVSSEPLATQQSDLYKFGLLVLRLFAGLQVTRTMSDAKSLPPNLEPLLRRSLSRDRRGRPTAVEWLQSLAKVLGLASTALPRSLVLNPRPSISMSDLSSRARTPGPPTIRSTATIPLRTPPIAVPPPVTPVARPARTTFSLSGTTIVQPVQPGKRKQRRGRSLMKVLILVSLLALAVLLLLHDHSGQAQTVPCPTDAVVKTTGYPGTLVDHFTTDKYEVFVCSVPGNSLYYSAYQKSNTSVGITLPATQQGSAYVATNGSYRYQVDGEHLAVWQAGQLVTYQSVTAHSNQQ